MECCHGASPIHFSPLHPQNQEPAKNRATRRGAGASPRPFAKAGAYQPQDEGQEPRERARQQLRPTCPWTRSTGWAASSRASGRGRVPEAAGDTGTARAPGRVVQKFGGGPGQQGSTVSTQQGKANNGDIQQPGRSMSGQGSERLHNLPLWDTEAHPWPPAKPLTQATVGKGTEQTSSMPAQSHCSPSRPVAGRGQVLSGRGMPQPGWGETQPEFPWPPVSMWFPYPKGP